MEGTKRVEMNKSEVQATMPTAEDRFTASLKGIPLKDWEPGKEFIVLDDRIALIFDSRTLPPNPLSLHLRGNTLRFLKTELRVAPGLDTVQQIIFTDTARQYIYELKKSMTSSLGVPMLVDKNIVDSLDQKLRGTRLWVRNAVWQTGDSATLKGRKYIPVTVSEVTAGRNVYPVCVCFKTESGQSAWLPVSLGEAGPAARSFGRQFSLTDPRTQYPNISDENWNHIQNQDVAIGMTKNETLLALGSPQDISQGHNSAMMYELWQYPNGSYLIFEDGLLSRFKLAK